MLVSDVHCIVKNPLGKIWEANSAKPIENDSTTASIVELPNRHIFWAGNYSTHPVKKKEMNYLKHSTILSFIEIMLYYIISFV